MLASADDAIVSSACSGIPKTAFTAWVIVTVLALVAVGATMATPGEAGESARHLPGVLAATSELARPTLVVAVHPYCPCSRATLSGVEAHAPDLDIVLVISGPAAAGLSAPPSWLSSWAGRCDARVRFDVDGALATSLGALTSGHAVLYRRDGSLVFSGGLTPARGHAGPCPGIAAIRSLARGRTWKGAATAPVFGCPIFDAQCTPDLGACGSPNAPSSGI